MSNEEDVQKEVNFLFKKYKVLESCVNFLVDAVQHFQNYVLTTLIDSILTAINSSQQDILVDLVSKFCLLSNCFMAEYKYWLNGIISLPMHYKEATSNKKSSNELEHSCCVDNLIKTVGSRMQKKVFRQKLETLDTMLNSFEMVSDVKTVWVTIKYLQDVFNKRIGDKVKINSMFHLGAVEHQLEIINFVVNLNGKSFKNTLNFSSSQFKNFINCDDRKAFKISVSTALSFQLTSTGTDNTGTGAAGTMTGSGTTTRSGTNSTVTTATTSTTRTGSRTNSSEGNNKSNSAGAAKNATTGTGFGTNSSDGNNKSTGARAADKGNGSVTAENKRINSAGAAATATDSTAGIKTEHLNNTSAGTPGFATTATNGNGSGTKTTENNKSTFSRAARIATTGNDENKNPSNFRNQNKYNYCSEQ